MNYVLCKCLSWGDAYKPGAYTVSALTTISQAIYYSGGFGESGALRDIQLKRDGKIIRKLDMYDLLLKGDASNDVRLLPDDVVLIGSVNDTVSVEGEINRPAIYEVKQGETYQQLIQMAGGFTANAHTEQLEIKRYAPHGAREALTLDFNKTQDRQSKVKNGDAIKILKKKRRAYSLRTDRGGCSSSWLFGMAQWPSCCRSFQIC